MYAIKNNVQLVGAVVSKPLIKENGGSKQARFSIFIEDTYNNAKGLRVTETQSHTLVAKGKVASLAEKYLEKDMVVAVHGRLVNRQFRDSKGISRVVTEVMVNELLILNAEVRDEPVEYLLAEVSHN
jgi:single-strand DNA-binding protein